VSVERRPVHRLVASAARPGDVAAAVSEASLVTHQHRAGAEAVAVGYLCPVGPDLSISALTVSAVVSSDRAW
jgi:hypothetical protein